MDKYSYINIMPEIEGIIDQDSDIIPVQPEKDGCVRIVDHEGLPVNEYPADNITSIGDTSRGVSIAVTRSHPQYRTAESNEYFASQPRLIPELSERDPWKGLREGLSIATTMKDQGRFVTGISIADYKIGIATNGVNHELSKTHQTQAPDADYDIPAEQADKREIIRDAMNYLPRYYDETTDANKGGILNSADRIAKGLQPNEKRFIIDQIRGGDLSYVRTERSRAVAGMIYSYDRIITELSEAYIEKLEAYYQSEFGQDFLPYMDRQGNDNKVRLVKNTLGILYSELIKHRILRQNDQMFSEDQTATAGIADMMHQMYRNDIEEHQIQMGYAQISRGDLSRHTQAHIAARTPADRAWYKPGQIDFSNMIAYHIKRENRQIEDRDIASITAVCVSQIAELQNTISSLSYQREDSPDIERTLFTGDDVSERVNTAEHINAILAFLGAAVFPRGSDPFSHIR